nr:MAG TPA: hypothetical protein [Caudoviricetes sp.]
MCSSYVLDGHMSMLLICNNYLAIILTYLDFQDNFRKHYG